MPVFEVRQSEPLQGRSRRLRIEPLEDRRLLDASPGLDASVTNAPLAEPAAVTSLWQNPVYRLDVNRDARVSPADALGIINRLLDPNLGPGPLPNPGADPHPYYDTNGNGGVSSLDVLNVINGLLNPPKINVSSLTPFTIDVTPQVTIAATSTATLPNGTQLLVDVDLNNDGKFDGPGELGHSTSTLYNGSSTFDVTPALARQQTTYTVNLRARLQDADGVQGTSAALPLVVDTRTSDALKNYVQAADPSYDYILREALIEKEYTFYTIELTSQTWRSTADVDKPVWKHWLEVVVPTTLATNTALLLLGGGGGSNFESPPLWPDQSILAVALATNSVTAMLRMVPNTPLAFTGDPDSPRFEDEIIAYTLDKFMDHLGEPGNETWPALLPMAKSVVRAMDAVQDLIPLARAGTQINDFLLTGYSKRAWTTWLAAAVDSRVKAIIPGVFDFLNQTMNMVHHYGTYGHFAEDLENYTDAEVLQRFLTPEGLELSRITDPYRYLGDPRFASMPKLLINSTGDGNFMADGAQYYFQDLPGTKNYLRYIPNSNHYIDEGTALASTIAFYDALVTNKPLPQFSWTVAQDGSIHLHSDTTPSLVRLWKATNPTDRDFRRDVHTEINWTSTDLNSQGSGNYLGDVPLPATGATAYFIELTFLVPGSAYPHIFTTEIRVKSNVPLAPWPYPSGLPNNNLVSFANPLLAEGSISGASLAAQAGGRTPEEEQSELALGVTLAATIKPSGERSVSSAWTPPVGSLAEPAAEPIEPTSLPSLLEPATLELESSDEEVSTDAVDEVMARGLAFSVSD